MRAYTPSPLRSLDRFGILTLLVATLASVAGAEPARREVYAMGTRLTLEVDGLPPQALRAATEAAVQECERIEAACSTWRPESTWSHFNASHGVAFPIGVEWVRVLATATGWTKETGGAFDPVMGRLLRAWGTRTGGRTPTATELVEARAASGVGLLALDATHGTATLTQGAELEEGGFLKGYALDRMAQVLRAAGVRAATLDFGGQLIAFGTTREAGIAAADDRHRMAVELRLRDGSLSTSGTSEHGRHIVDPRTGTLCEAWGSTSVVASDGLTADILSTALFVMGPERGFAWAEAHRVAALFQRPGQSPRATSSFARIAGWSAP